MADRPDVPAAVIDRIDAILARCPQCASERAWTGLRWKVAGRTVAHVFGGEDQRFRITFRAAGDEVMAFEHMGEPYFRGGWGDDVVGLLIDDDTDWTELAELLVESYCIRAPHLADQVARPGA